MSAKQATLCTADLVLTSSNGTARYILEGVNHELHQSLPLTEAELVESVSRQLQLLSNVFGPQAMTSAIRSAERELLSEALAALESE